MLPIIITAVGILVVILIVEYVFLKEEFSDISGSDASGATTDTLIKLLLLKLNAAIGEKEKEKDEDEDEEEKDTSVSTDAKEFGEREDILSSIQKTIRNEFKQRHIFDESILAPCCDSENTPSTLQGAEYNGSC